MKKSNSETIFYKLESAPNLSILFVTIIIDDVEKHKLYFTGRKRLPGQLFSCFMFTTVRKEFIYQNHIQLIILLVVSGIP